MTTRYECDRCHRQFENEKKMATVDITQYASGMKIEIEYHLCGFCRTIAFNALFMALDGKYGGSLKDTDMIGYFPDKKNDPLFGKGGEE